MLIMVLGFRAVARNASEASVEGCRRIAKLAELWRARTRQLSSCRLISAIVASFYIIATGGLAQPNAPFRATKSRVSKPYYRVAKTPDGSDCIVLSLERNTARAARGHDTAEGRLTSTPDTSENS